MSYNAGIISAGYIIFDCSRRRRFRRDHRLYARQVDRRRIAQARGRIPGKRIALADLNRRRRSRGKDDGRAGHDAKTHYAAYSDRSRFKSAFCAAFALRLSPHCINGRQFRGGIRLRNVVKICVDEIKFWLRCWIGRDIQRRSLCVFQCGIRRGGENRFRLHGGNFGVILRP